MSRKKNNLSTTAERRAEQEIDTFLRKINGMSSLDIMTELKKISE